MIKKENISLKPYNTFGVDVKASCIYDINSIEDLKELSVNKVLGDKSYLVLGGGSNILFTQDFNGDILKMDIKGKEVINEDAKKVEIKIGAGEELSEIVEWTVKNNWLGIQNLAWIPGTVGATPVQNVGAYGTEIKDVLKSIEYWDTQTNEIKIITPNFCKFGYRDSIFKHELKDIAIITSITITLDKYPPLETIPDKYLAYGDISKILKEEYNPPYTLLKVYEAICKIRKNKLPDVKEYGSCGSTFQNPRITIPKYEELKTKYPELPSFETDDKNIVKIPAAYILEQLGWKNKRVGNCGTWTHPLIVTNYNNASAKEILDLIHQIQNDFLQDAGVKLEPEINII